MPRTNRWFTAAALSLVALSAPAFLPSTAHAQTYNVATDFSFAANPTGVWSYGFTSDLGGTLSLLDVQFGSAGSIRGWQSSRINSLGTPAVYRNDSSTTSLGVPPGGVGVHPGPDGSIADFVVIRFTAPQTTTYTLNAQFFAGDTGNTDAYILRNSLAATPLYSVASTTTNPAFTGPVTLNLGDTLDFVVGTGGDNYFSDTTPVSISLTNTATAAPEPGTLALLLPGIALLGGGVRRKTS